MVSGLIPVQFNGVNIISVTIIFRVFAMTYAFGIAIAAIGGVVPVVGIIFVDSTTT
jgi:hypothetical protein